MFGLPFVPEFQIPSSESMCKALVRVLVEAYGIEDVKLRLGP